MKGRQIAGMYGDTWFELDVWRAVAVGKESSLRCLQKLIDFDTWGASFMK